MKKSRVCQAIVLAGVMILAMMLSFSTPFSLSAEESYITLTVRKELLNANGIEMTQKDAKAYLVDSRDEFALRLSLAKEQQKPADESWKEYDLKIDGGQSIGLSEDIKYLYIREQLKDSSKTLSDAYSTWISITPNDPDVKDCYFTLVQDEGQPYLEVSVEKVIEAFQNHPAYEQEPPLDWIVTVVNHIKGQEFYDLIIEKKWEKVNAEDQPESTISIVTTDESGKEEHHTVTFDGNDNGEAGIEGWTQKLSNALKKYKLDKFGRIAVDENGEKVKFEYQAVEKPVPDGYTVQYLEPVYNEDANSKSVKFVVVNTGEATFTQEKVELTVEKKWQDSTGEPVSEEKIKDSQGEIKTVEFKLFADGIEKAESYFLASKDNWQTKVSVPKYQTNENGELIFDENNGKPIEIVYTIEEVVLDGWTSEVSKNGDVFTITNTESEDVSDETIEIRVKKIWDDNENAQDKRPGKIVLKLLQGERIVETLELLEPQGDGVDPNVWEGSFGYFPIYDYTVKEDAVNGYEPSYEVQTEEGEGQNKLFTITNHLKEDTIPDDPQPEDPTPEQPKPESPKADETKKEQEKKETSKQYWIPKVRNTPVAVTNKLEVKVDAVKSPTVKAHVPATGESGKPYFVSVTLLALSLAMILIKRKHS